MSNLIAQVVAGLEIGLAIAGAVLLWRLELRPAARARQPAPRLLPWNGTVIEFLLFLLLVIGGSFLLAAVASVLAKSFSVRGDASTLVTGAGAQLGMLAGVWAYRRHARRDEPVVVPGGPGIVVSGAVTFLMSLPLLLISAKAWELLLKALGLPTERQSLIAMFANADSPWLLAFMITLAIVIAPLTEEHVFRAGVFRFLRGCMPRWTALLVSALLFASLHVNWTNLEGLTSLVPLMVLAVMFSLAYEQTGKIGTAIVAHGLFNLNTVILIFSGVGL